VPSYPGAIDLTDVQAHLNDTGTWSTAKQAEVQHFLDAAIAT
jgi:hypothetical protein